MSHRTMKLLAASFVSALGIVASESNAILITHNTSTVLFSENFESQTVGNNWNNNVAGQWLLSGPPLVSNSAPGAYQGSQYGFIERNLVDTSDTARAQFTSVSSGRLDLDTMVYIPGTQQFLSIVLGNNLGTNPPAPDANVHSYIVFQLNSTHNMQEVAGASPEYMASTVPGMLYKNNEWMRLQVGYDFANAASGYTVRLTTSSGSYLWTRPLNNPGAAINTMLIKFEDNGNSAYFDAVVPEPSMAIAALGILGGMLSSRRRRLA